MNTRDTTLQELVYPQGNGVPDEAWSKILLNPTVILVLATFALNIVDVVKSEIRNSIGTLLKMSLLDVLVGGWKKYDEVSRALEKSKQTPDDTVLESLADHIVKSVHHPYIELFKDDTSVGKIEFEYAATLNVQGVQLKIRNGEIVEILTGSCKGSVKLSLAGETLSESQTGDISLPGSIAVAQGAGHADDVVTAAAEQHGREPAGTVQVTPESEPVVEKPAWQNPLLKKRTGLPQPAQPPVPATLPESPASRPGSIPLGQVVIAAFVLLGLCICCSLFWLGVWQR